MSYPDRMISYLASGSAAGLATSCRFVAPLALFLFFAEGICFAQQPLCVPGTPGNLARASCFELFRQPSAATFVVRPIEGCILLGRLAGLGRRA